ncbi:MAG: hypothetical protein CENE_00085 [Candidatus Celerinatantimonas neptuna]|nr:MAG: hypothetical protein CENE_00085 [Candidatus Celerinatantimonas neptuna]
MTGTMERIELEHGAWLIYWPQWFADDEPQLGEAIPWQAHQIRIFGRWVNEPRLSAWIADPGLSYRYSGQLREPLSWPELLLPIRERLKQDLSVDFNSVLANLYRNGQDAMGWHSDNEPELGHEPLIASLSLGQPRRFLIRENKQRHPVLELSLGGGDLVVMGGTLQHYYQHQIARTKKMVGPRINLTFRRIVSKGG